MNSLLSGFQMTFSCWGGSQCYQLRTLGNLFPWVMGSAGDGFDLKMPATFRRDPLGKCRTAELRRQNGLIGLCLPGFPDIPWPLCLSGSKHPLTCTGEELPCYVLLHRLTWRLSL